MTYDSGHFVGRDKFDSDSLLQGSFTLHLLRRTVGVGVVSGVASSPASSSSSSSGTWGKKGAHSALYHSTWGKLLGILGGLWRSKVQGSMEFGGRMRGPSVL